MSEHWEFFVIEEDWLATNRAETEPQIQEGWGEAERGELIDGDDVPRRWQKIPTSVRPYGVL